MGIKNLNAVLKKSCYFPKKNINDIKYSIVAVDFSLFLYRFIYNQNNPIECFLRQLILFFKNNILPVYVLDGIAPTEKYTILNKRANKRIKVSEELSRLLEYKEELLMNNASQIVINNLDQEIIRLEKKCVQFSKDETQQIISFFKLCGVPVIQENYESDWILAKLSQYNLVDFVLSEDSDLLAFGASKIMKNFSIQEESFELYDLDIILNTLEFNQKEFVDMCILCGCDYAPKLKNINNVRAYELIKKYRNIESTEINTNIEAINSARKVFLKDIKNELIENLSKKIVKYDFQYDNIEKFLQENIEKKYLIPSFLKICHKFLQYKFT